MAENKTNPQLWATVTIAVAFIGCLATVSAAVLPKLIDTLKNTPAPSVTPVAQTQPTITPIITTTPTPQIPIGKVFFVSNMDGNNEIYRYDFAAKDVARITNTIEMESFPSVSPDGKRVCFESLATGHLQISCTDTDGNNNVNLSNDAAEEGMPRFSPDGRFIAYHRREVNNDTSWEIWIMNSDGSNKRRLTYENSYMGEPSWFPDGSKLVFDGDKPDRNIITINLDGSDLRVINNKPGEQRGPAVSPDGQYIYYDSSENGSFQIYRMRIDGSQQTPLTIGYLPSISPNGKWLIFSNYMSDDNSKIYICETPDCNTLQLIKMNLGKNEVFSWIIP